MGVELFVKFTKSRVVTVLHTANQMNWSQMELTKAKHQEIVTRGGFPQQLSAEIGHEIAWGIVANLRI